MNLFGASSEWEQELTSGWPPEHAGEFESEQFFGWLKALAQGARQSPTLKRAARLARAAALTGRIAGLATHPLPMPALPVDAPIVTPADDPRRRDKHDGSDHELFARPEASAQPGRSRTYFIALMEHMGSVAAGATAAAEADALVGALVPLALRLLPQSTLPIARVVPTLTWRIAAISRALGRRTATRPLLRLLPAIVRHTIVRLARHHASGEIVTPALAARTLAQQSAFIINSPQRCLEVYRRSRLLDRNYHRRAGFETKYESESLGESTGIGISVPCPFDSCAQTRDPDTGLVVCVDRGCANGCQLRNTWLGLMCCCN
jgi:hypothetical protein